MNRDIASRVRPTFRSFVSAGFDCTVGRNVCGDFIDHTVATRHEQQLESDYRLMRGVGIQTVRDGMPWPNVETTPGTFDWARFDRIVEASARYDIQVIYDLCHFGYPEYLDVLSDEFVKRFAEYCYAVANRLRQKGTLAPFVTPLNEPSYYAWAAGDAALFYPYKTTLSHPLKVQFVRAILAGSDAIKSVLPEATIVNVDPICRVVTPRNKDLRAEAMRFNDGAVMEAWDMLSGKMYPELGGTPAKLGLVGVNYYWINQWELGTVGVPLADDDSRRVSLDYLVRVVWERYGAPIFLSETAHLGEARAAWIGQLVNESRSIVRGGIDLRGICLYPVVGMPSWRRPTDWLAMGLWDVDTHGRRIACKPALNALANLQKLEDDAEDSRGSRNSTNGHPASKPS